MMDDTKTHLDGVIKLELERGSGSGGSRYSSSPYSEPCGAQAEIDSYVGMSWSEYRKEVVLKCECGYDNAIARLRDEKTVRLLHGILGMVDEAGELAGALKKHIFYGKELDRPNLIEELGDSAFFSTMIIDCIGSTLGDVLSANKRKLIDGRYKNGFSEHAALHRDLAKERELLSDTYDESVAEKIAIANRWRMLKPVQLVTSYAVDAINASGEMAGAPLLQLYATRSVLEQALYDASTQAVLAGLLNIVADARILRMTPEPEADISIKAVLAAYVDLFKGRNWLQRHMSTIIKLVGGTR